MSDDSDSRKSNTMAMFKTRTYIRMGYVVGGCALLLGLSLVLYRYQAATPSAHFISLLVLFMASLAITSAVFSGLQLGDRGEAFGLPSGSVRALLAVGVILLFVAFGLPLLPNESDAAAKGKQPQAIMVQIDAERLPEATASYVQQHFQIIIDDYGAPAKDNLPARQARLRLLPPDHFAERFEISKQLITAIITLLTSVISYYFGSRAVTDAMRSSPSDQGVTTDLQVRRRELGARIDALKNSISERTRRIEAIAVAPDPEAADEIAARQQAAEAVATRRKAIEDKLAAIAQGLKATDDALASLSATTAPDVRAVNEQSATSGLAALQDAIKSIEEQLPAFDAEIDAYQQHSAVG